MFLFKSKKIHLDCFTLAGTVAEDNPIQKSSEFIPNWWKKLPPCNLDSTIHGVEVKRPTMKKCLGFIDLYKTGVVIPLWSDANIRINENTWAYEFAIGKLIADDPIVAHGENQYEGLLPNNKFLHIKLNIPWILSEKTGTKFLMVNSLWSNLSIMPKIHILPGILNFRTQHAANINAFLSTENQPYQYNLEAGIPLVQLVPLSEKDVVPHIHEISKSEWDKISLRWTRPYKFTGWGIHQRKIYNKMK